MTKQEANNTIEEVKHLIIEDNYINTEQILLDELGLEMDYVMELLI